ncbi:Lrp/AsnC family transcriptional regulator [Hoeflea poritis]|uniref:Lrp/AsnC family transcriptional regulator n=1 Tax=Hoeflea poritis TaxID=2993659 RepID=A0ABT4VSN4_9HYPH|nr:Lrp/AsnC family transcriptional regulator [Hoeflea poritis]MDA4847013.1 Lrp/AsnC family transcriptional regulator [Hoeflea poritis]
MASLDRTDHRILALLSKNARMSNKELAHAVDLSPSSVHERTRRLFENGVLAGAHADVRLDRLGLALRALLFVQMSEHEKTNLDAFVKGVLQIPEVQAAWMISGRFDAVVELVTRNTDHLHRIVVEKFSSRDEIHRIETSIIFENARQNDLSATLELAQ